MKTALSDGAAPQWSGEAAARRIAADAQGRGYFTETIPAKHAQVNSAALPTGFVMSVGFGVAKGDTFNACDVGMTTAGSALTLVKAAIARSSDGVVLAVSADLSGTMAGATGKKPCPFLAQHVAPEDDYYQFYILSVGTTGPILRSGSANAPALHYSGRAGFKDAYGRLGAQADLVVGSAYVPAASGVDNAIWAGFY